MTNDIRDMLQENRNVPLSQPGFIMDKASTIAYQAAQKKKEKAERLAFNKLQKEKFKKWSKDRGRVDLYNNLYKIENTTKREVVIEVFCTVKDKKESSIILQEDGLAGVAKLDMKLHPIAKRLADGKIFTISDELTRWQENPRYIEWLKIAAGSPQYKEFVPEPEKYHFPIESLWKDARFVLNKFHPEISPAAYFTYRVSDMLLGEELKID